MTSSQHLPSLSRERMHHTYGCLFHPRSIAVIGASADTAKPGGRVFKTILHHGYGGRLWPVNPRAASILGCPAYASVNTLPGPPELAIIAIPAPLVKTALIELAEQGTAAVIVLTSGFGEKDLSGKKAEQELCSIADSAGMVLIGPNCSGFLTSTYKGKFAGIIPPPGKGAVDFISGSGATVDYVMEAAIGRGLTFGSVVNLGNSVQMGVEDLLALYDANYGRDNARILLLYLEAVNKPQLLLRHAQSLVAKGCHLVAIKSGTTEAGSRAAASHTGAMTSNNVAVQALFEKAGIIRVSSRQELIDVACILHAAGGRLRGKRLAVVTDAGGPGVMLADQLAKGGLQLPIISKSTRLALAKFLPPESSLANPIDLLPSRNAEQMGAVLRLLDREEGDNLDAIAVLTGDSGLSDNGTLYQAISAAMEHSQLPILPVLSSLFSCSEHIRNFTASGKIFFPDEVALGRALGLCVDRKSLPQHSQQALLSSSQRDGISTLLQAESGALSSSTVQKALTTAGFPLPRQEEVVNANGLASACQRLGYPLAMKVIGPLHKTDVGGVHLGITSEKAATDAWHQLMAIPEAQGVLLQEMVEGLELILGASREGDFGHLLMFGLGGIHTEVTEDVTFALAPIDSSEATTMIDTIRGHAILDGVRGAAGIDRGMVSDALVRLGHLVSAFPQIRELDLNPLKGWGTKLVVVDARIVVD